MDKDEFKAYCQMMSNMMNSFPTWYNMPNSIVSDFLINVSDQYGYGKVLHDMAQGAYKILDGDKNLSKDTLDLYELAAKLNVSLHLSNYNFLAYLFAVSVFSICMNRKDLDSLDLDIFDSNELIMFDVSSLVEEEIDPVKRKLLQYRMCLLDVSRNNKLVHFKYAKSSSLLLQSPQLIKTMQEIENGKPITISKWSKLNPNVILKCKICGRYDFRKYDFSLKKYQATQKCEICDQDNKYNRKSMVPLKEKLTIIKNHKIKCECGNEIDYEEFKKNQICSNCGKRIQLNSYPLVDISELNNFSCQEVFSSIGDLETGEVFQKLYNKAKNMEINFGLHVLYVACGFLKWKDINSTEYYTPLLLCPIKIQYDRDKGTLYFVADEQGKFEVNKTLIHMLSSYSQYVSIKLPEVDSINLSAYFNLVKSALRSNEEIAKITADWQVFPEMVISLFYYQKLQLENDIKLFEQNYLNHALIRRLCGDSSSQIEKNESSSSSLQYMILDADSSQEEVLKASQNGSSFILQGPPGSGKSQTITNIICTAIGEGKSVLFVTEKASARSIILDNLKMQEIDDTHSLTDFVLNFSDLSLRGGSIVRKSFLEEVNKSFKISYVPNYDTGSQAIINEAHGKQKIEDYMTNLTIEYQGQSYIRLLHSLADFAHVEDLNFPSNFPSAQESFITLCDLIYNYYNFYNSQQVAFNYKLDTLYEFKGDKSQTLLPIVNEYEETSDKLVFVSDRLKEYGWKINNNKKEFEHYLDLINLWSKMPALPQKILFMFEDKKLQSVLKYITKRTEMLDKMENHVGQSYAFNINNQAFLSNYKYLLENKAHFKHLWKRLGKKYQIFLTKVKECFNSKEKKLNYNLAIIEIEKLIKYQEYLDIKNQYEAGLKEDYEMFDIRYNTLEEWKELEDNIKHYQEIILHSDPKTIALEKTWLNKFTFDNHSEQIVQLKNLSTILKDTMEHENKLLMILASYFHDFKIDSQTYPCAKKYVNLIKSNSQRLKVWSNIYNLLEELKKHNWDVILDELIKNNIQEIESAKEILFKAYYKSLLNDFVNKNRINCVDTFNKVEHQRVIKNYAEADKEMIKTGAKRLYDTLNLRIKNKLEKTTQIRIKPNSSIKETIKENWDRQTLIKPCFMMSPLNVSQYIDITNKFDLVVFDEASQIFTEDALASIVRGKQIIIAGDSKQLPPCDFFRAGDVSMDFDEQYFMDELNLENSLLNKADEVLSDTSKYLNWHYRSYDEALIAFSNEHLKYNLITFPSAIKDLNDGIRYVPIPYNPATCYEGGKNASHINKGEAKKIVELIWKEMNDEQRMDFSIGVVAFSNAQALEIEAEWLEFKQMPDKKDYINAWEKKHQAEPIIFCNLDTMQGDERDTMLLSICYSQDKNNKFLLSYLGRIRLSSGKKRINVAVTRARHQMIVVSTLTQYVLNSAIESSSAPDENKEGAKLLLEFLKYAESFKQHNDIISAPTNNPLVKSVLRVLDEAHIAYKTEIGRSDCKINIGICDPYIVNGFILGIIIDDPRRPDFDSPREYARLTQQILETKYKWNLYRIFPISWIFDYQNEKQALLNYISTLINTIPMNTYFD